MFCDNDSFWEDEGKVIRIPIVPRSAVVQGVDAPFGGAMFSMEYLPHPYSYNKNYFNVRMVTSFTLVYPKHAVWVGCRLTNKGCDSKKTKHQNSINENNIQPQQENPDLEGLYRLRFDSKKNKEGREDNSVELVETGSTDKFKSEDGTTILEARTSLDDTGKYIFLRQALKNQPVPNGLEQQCDDLCFSKERCYGYTGRIGDLPKDMRCLADDPQRILDEYINGCMPFGKKYVVSKTKNS